MLKVGDRLQVGDQAPDFAFASEAFGSISAASLRGKRYVMYFYPKDDTPGCTREACAFRDNHPRFRGLGVKVLGVSADDEKSHFRFARKHALTFKLIPDPDHVICEAFGTWVEKNMYGRHYMGVARSTFVIGPDGKIEKIWEKVAPDGHAEEVFAWLNGDPVPVPVKPVTTKPAAVKTAGVSKTTATLTAAAKPTPEPSAKSPPLPPVATTKALAPKQSASSKTAAGAATGTQAGQVKKAGPLKKAASEPLPGKQIPGKAAVNKAAARKVAAAKPIVSKSPLKKSAAKGVSKSAATKKVVKKSVSNKSVPKKAALKKTAPKKTLAKKAALKNVQAKKPAKPKLVAKKSAPGKASAKKSVAKKSVGKGMVAKKGGSKKPVATKKQRR